MPRSTPTARKAGNAAPDRQSPQMATITETARIYQISRNTLYRWIAEGHITAYKAGRILRVDLDSVDAWLRPINGGEA